MSFILLLWLVLGGIVSAETTEALLTQIKSTVADEMKLPEEKRDYVAQRLSYIFFPDISYGEPAIRSDESLLPAMEFAATQSANTELRNLCRTYCQQARAEVPLRQAALVEKTKKILAEALRTGLAASQIEDLQAPLAAVHQLTDEDYTSQDSQIQWLRQLVLFSAPEYLRLIQDCIAIHGNRDSRIGRDLCEELCRDQPAFHDLMPRSEFLARLAAFKDRFGISEKHSSSSPGDFNNRAQAIVLTTNSLSDIPRTIKQLEGLARSRDAEDAWHGDAFSKTLGLLRTYQKLHEELKKGEGTSIDLKSVIRNFTYSRETMRALHQQLLLLALPRILGIPETQGAQPEENIPTYLHRVATQAVAASDWPLLGRTFGAAQTLDAKLTFGVGDAETLQSFLTGIALERAQEYVPAVRSYETALATGSQILPPKIVGDRLERIHREHPQEFLAAVTVQP